MSGRVRHRRLSSILVLWLLIRRADGLRLRFVPDVFESVFGLDASLDLGDDRVVLRRRKGRRKHGCKAKRRVEKAEEVVGRGWVVGRAREFNKEEALDMP
jgi:hypothetical protein